MPSASTKSARIRARLGHPIIDSDGHWIEYEPVALEYLERVGGPSLVKRYKAVSAPFGAVARMALEIRKQKRISQFPWWGVPTKNTLDRATAMMPLLMHKRLGDMGMDFAVVYSTGGSLFAPFLRDEEVRKAACCAYNIFLADSFREFSDRLTPAAVIPMHTPAEAIAELEHVKELGLKVIMMSSMLRRPVPEVAHKAPEYLRYALWMDVLGLDSDYDYDPVWQKCIDLGLAPTFHSSVQGYGLHSSLTNMVYNHIGHFGAAGEAVCKALFLGGVTTRFPQLKCAFLEGGVSWGCRLYADLIGHWRVRNLNALANIDPNNLDIAELTKLVRQYGSGALKQKFDPARVSMGDSAPENLDDFVHCAIQRPEDIRERYVPNFFFGCEAEDPMTAWAFNATVNPYGARLNAVLGSDIGHWDVPDMTEIAAEAYELVERGLMSESDFRDFTFTNPVKLWASLNPDFFKGTAVESDVARELAKDTKQPPSDDPEHEQAPTRRLPHSRPHPVYRGANRDPLFGPDGSGGDKAGDRPVGRPGAFAATAEERAKLALRPSQPRQEKPLPRYEQAPGPGHNQTAPGQGGRVRREFQPRHHWTYGSWV
jgi:predicted TIM-barrel fold metal-dependent hydrolase